MLGAVGRVLTSALLSSLIVSAVFLLLTVMPPTTTAPNPSESPASFPTIPVMTYPPVFVGPSPSGPAQRDDRCETARLRLGFYRQLFGQVLDDIDRYPEVQDFRDGLASDAEKALTVLEEPCFTAKTVRSWRKAIRYLLDPGAAEFSTDGARSRLSSLDPPR